MLEYCNLSGFADEISDDVKVQIQVLRKLGISQLDFRSVGGKGIAELSCEEAEELYQLFRSEGIHISAIASPIGKIPITQDFEPHFQQLEHIFQLAEILKTRYIRIFSFYMPDGETETYENFQDQVFQRMERMVSAANQHHMVLLHENEKKIYGDIAKRCEQLFQRFYGESFQGIFDFANFVQCGQDTWEAYQMLMPYIDYIHIKDARKDSGQIVPAGEGDGQIQKILKELDKRGYQGILSLEPHLADFSQLQKLEEQKEERQWVCSTGEEAFCYAYQALKKLL